MKNLNLNKVETLHPDESGFCVTNISYATDSKVCVAQVRIVILNLAERNEEFQPHKI